MEKTTVYLPKDVKRRLRARARERGVSEAQLIREGLDAVLAPRPRYPLFDSGGRLSLSAEQMDEDLKGMGLDSLPRDMRARYERRPPKGTGPAPR